jgi:hypothetical protein
VTAAARERIAPVFPDGYDRGLHLAPLWHSAIWHPKLKVGAEKRREITFDDPLLFALLYIEPFLRDGQTGTISFSEMHMQAFRRMRRWIGSGQDRSGWASYRGAGKSVTWFLTAPLWALAHGHRGYFLALSNTGDQAKEKLADLKGVIETNERLLYDFPHLRPGRPWTETNAVTRGGQRMKAGGMEKKLLGTRQRELRPDLVVGDDLEPGPADWTPASKAKTLGRLVNDVLPAGQWNTATVLVGTPVGMGSIMHDVVRAARGRPGALGDRGEWVRGNGFVPYWFPAIVDAGGPRQRSAWETRFPLEDLLEEQEADKRTFVLQMQCDPDDPAAQQWWTEDTFRYDSRFVSDHRILSIDGAVTRKATSDHSAVAVLAVSGSTPATMRVCVEHAESGHWSRTELKERAWALTAQYPRSLRTWLVDATGSGDHWLEALSPPPPGVEIVPFTTTADPKRHRIETLFDDYARGAVLHGRRLAALEGQMVSWKPGKSGPAVDDLIDAVRAGKDFLLYGDASRAPAKKGVR